MKRALFIDRDGVLDALVFRHGEWGAPLVPEQVELLPGVAAALRRAAEEEWLLFVVSNQPNAAKGQTTIESLQAVHDALVTKLAGAPVTEWFYCYHQGTDRCSCRKPSPQFVLDAAKKYEVDLAASWFAGDQDSDVECGRRAGCRTALLQYPHSSPKRGTQRADLVVRDLPELVSRIIEEHP
jgi:D-glycero-D-manno-heptose 1,7-bisphosphate phosphatase